MPGSSHSLGGLENLKKNNFFFSRGGLPMDITTDAIKEKIAIMYPEIKKHNVNMSVDFDAAKDAFIVKRKTNYSDYYS
jgi:hypothetical protein